MLNRRLRMSLVAFLLLATSVAQAGTVRNQNLTRLISDSQSIIQGTVKSVTDGIDGNGMPYTEVTIVVHSSAKGNVADDTEYTFRQFGLLKPRTLENGNLMLAVTPEGFPNWNEGESVVAFLYQPASMSGLQTTTGLVQGKLTQINDHLLNGVNNIGLFEGVAVNQELLSPEEQNMLITPGAVNTETFMGLVQRAVSEGWIESGEMQ